MVARKTLHAELVPQSFRMVRRSFLGRGEVGVGLGLLWALTCELVPHERILKADCWVLTMKTDC